MRLLSLLVSLPLAAAIPAQGLVFGSALPFTPRPAGDVDGDGFDDYSGTVGGNLVVHSGATGLPIPHMTQPAGTYGYAPVGDTNADGHDDVVRLVTAPNGDVDAVVVSGADGSTLHTWLLMTFIPNALQFPSVVGGADFDADGFGDVLLVSTDLFTVRSGRTGDVLHSLSAGGALAPATAAIGDWNGDGFSDFTVSIGFQSVMVIRHGPDFWSTGMSGKPMGVGDMNCNGASDIAIHPIGGFTMNIVDGATGLLLGTLPYSNAGALNVWSIRDLDGDGHEDLAVQMPAQTFPPQAAFRDVFSGQTLVPFAGAVNLNVGRIGDIDGDGRNECSTTVAGVPTVFEWVDPAVPLASRMTRRGASGTTSIGTKPKLVTRGSCALDKTVFFDMRGALPNGIALLVLGPAVDVDLAVVGAPGNRLYADLAWLEVLLPEAHGLATKSFLMPNTPSLLGATISVQAAAADAAANPLGFVTSNAIDLVTNN